MAAPHLSGGRKLIFALAGGTFLFAGILLLRADPYRAQTVVSGAGGCAMRVDILEPVSGDAQGYVVLLHGLSANKRVMGYLAEGFAYQNLRVFVPDFPGHGRTPGPFTPERAEFCAASLVNELIERRAILPQRTILAGHSLGAAIAMRMASRLPVAGVIALSPAPMHVGHGVSKDMLPFRDSGPLPSRTLAMRGAWEPSGIRQLDQDTLAPALDSTSKYVLVPGATHVSLLFNHEVVRQNREWLSRILAISPQAPAPSQWPLFGFILGIVGLSFLTVPFLNKTFAQWPAHNSAGSAGFPSPALASPLAHPAPARELLQICAVSVVCVAVLHFGVPLRFLRIFQGDYLASFFLIAGLALLLWNRKNNAPLRLSWRPIFAAFLVSLALLLIFSAWFDFAFYEAWLTLPRWLRFPAVFLALLPWHLAEEALLGPWGALSRWKRFSLALAFRSIAWLAMVAGLFYLHSGQVLILLLAAYFAVFFLLQRLAIDVAHRKLRSATAAAVFGAILFAGLALAIFPVA